MSLASVGDVKETTTVTLKHPKPRMSLKNPDGTDMTVEMHGPYSARYKAVQRAMQQERMQEMSRGGSPEMSAEEMERADHMLIARCIEGWNIWETDDVKLDFSEEAALDLMSARPWVFTQLYVAINTTGNFIDTPKQD